MRLSSSSMNLRPRKRHKGPVASAVTSSSVSTTPPLVGAHHASGSATPTFVDLSSDAMHTFLSLLKESTDVFPPLKSAAGAVLAVWDLAERVSASDDNARALAVRAVGILDAIYNAVGGGAGPIVPKMLQDMEKFEALLRDISAAMERHLKSGRLRRVLHLRRQESQLARFTARLDAAAEAFKIASSTHIQLASTRIESTSTRIESISTRVELAVEKIQADVSSTAALAVALEESNIRLRGEVQVLRRTVVLFGVTPVSLGFSESGCVCAL